MFFFRPRARLILHLTTLCLAWLLIASPTLPTFATSNSESFGFASSSLQANGYQPWNGALEVTIPQTANPRILSSLRLEPATEINVTVTGHTARVQPAAGAFQKDTLYTLGVQFPRICPALLEQTSCHTTEAWLYKLVFRTTSNEARILGYSHQNRPVWGHSFGRCREEASCRRVMLTGAVHGNEGRSGDLGRLIQILDTEPDYLAGQNKEIFVIPQVNPDGVAAGTRHNARGVDLNRNFPAQWGNPCQACGSAPASERETQLVVNATETFDPTHLLSYHAQWPPHGIIFRGSDTNPDTIAFAEYAARHSGYPVGQFNTSGDVPGDQTVWAESRGTRSLLIEATRTDSTDWDKNWPLYQALLRDSKFR